MHVAEEGKIKKIIKIENGVFVEDNKHRFTKFKNRTEDILNGGE